MIDFHSHILPGIDDGASDVEESISMLEYAKNQGVDVIVATPHYYTETSIDEFLELRKNSYETLIEECNNRNLDIPEIILGAEVYLTNDLFDAGAIEKLCIGDTNTILVEMPYSYWHSIYYDKIYYMYSKYKLKPVIAHLDRYLMADKKSVDIKKLLGMEVSVQINADTIVYDKKLAKKILREDMIDVLGSDTHDMNFRKSTIKEAENYIRSKFGDELITEIEDKSKKLLNINWTVAEKVFLR